MTNVYRRLLFGLKNYEIDPDAHNFFDINHWPIKKSDILQFCSQPSMASRNSNKVEQFDNVIAWGIISRKLRLIRTMSSIYNIVAAPLGDRRGV